VSHNNCWGPTVDVREHQSDCLICSQKLEYLKVSKRLKCINCNKEEYGNIVCVEGHYICDECHGKKYFEAVLELIIKSKGTNPFYITRDIIDLAKLPMLGCEHTWVVSGALMISIKNAGFDIDDKDVLEAINRTRKQSIGGYCGLSGICGISVSIGTVFSVLLGAGCPKDTETRTTMKVVAKVVDAIADQTGPCCCKNFSYTALEIACEELKEKLNIVLDSNNDIICDNSNEHPHGCIKERCNYFDTRLRS